MHSICFKAKKTQQLNLEEATFRRTKPVMRRNNNKKNKKSQSRKKQQVKPKRGDNVFGSPYSNDGDELPVSGMMHI